MSDFTKLDKAQYIILIDKFCRCMKNEFKDEEFLLLFNNSSENVRSYFAMTEIPKKVLEYYKLNS